MSRFKFASVFHPNDYGYALDTDEWHSSPEVSSGLTTFVQATYDTLRISPDGEYLAETVREAEVDNA